MVRVHLRLGRKTTFWDGVWDCKWPPCGGILSDRKSQFLVTFTIYMYCIRSRKVHAWTFVTSQGKNGFMAARFRIKIESNGAVLVGLFIQNKLTGRSLFSQNAGHNIFLITSQKMAKVQSVIIRPWASGSSSGGRTDTKKFYPVEWIHLWMMTEEIWPCDRSQN